MAEIEAVVKVAAVSSEDPPEETLYQLYDPAEPEADKATVPVPHLEASVRDGAEGEGVSFTLTSAVFTHPLVSVTCNVYVPAADEDIGNVGFCELEEKLFGPFQ